MSTSNTYALRSRAIAAFRPHIHSGVRTAGVICILAWLQAGPAATREQIVNGLGIKSPKSGVNSTIRAMRGAGLIRCSGSRLVGPKRTPCRVYAAGPETGVATVRPRGNGDDAARRVARMLNAFAAPLTATEMGDVIGHRASTDRDVIGVMHAAGLIRVDSWRFVRGSAGPMIPRYVIGSAPDAELPVSASAHSEVVKAAVERKRAAPPKRPAAPVSRPGSSITIGVPARAEQIAMLFALAGHNTLGVHV